MSVGETNDTKAIANVFGEHTEQYFVVEHFRVNSPLRPARQEVDDGECSCLNLVCFSGKKVSTLCYKNTRGK